MKRNNTVKQAFAFLFGVTCLVSQAMSQSPEPVLEPSEASVAVIGPGTEPITEQSASQLAQPLVGAKLKTVPVIIETLEQSAGEPVLPLFEAMLDSRLYYQRTDKQLVIINKQDDGSYALTEPFTGESLGISQKSAIKKVRVNNKIRVQLRSAIARLTLFHRDAAVRESAVRNMLNRLDDNSVELLLTARDQEQNRSVLALIDLAIAIHNLESSGDQSVRLAALGQMEGSLEPVVRNSLAKVLEQDAEGNYIEPDKRVYERAEKIAEAIQGKIEFYGVVETLFFGLSFRIGSVTGSYRFGHYLRGNGRYQYGPRRTDYAGGLYHLCDSTADAQLY